jgi:NDP-sugar pyrophosphorylase family protein
MIDAVIQAGGKGTRLRPYTYVLPKPLMPLGNSTLLETNIRWLSKHSLTNVIVTLGYLGHIIKAVLGNEKHGAKFQYYEESLPLGTAGSLSFLKESLNDDFLLMNGDLVVDIDLIKFKKQHIENNNGITIGVTKHIQNIEYGVVDIDSGDNVIGFSEKPSMEYPISMGIYYINNEILSLIPKGAPFGMDDLIKKVLRSGKNVGVYYHEGEWVDVGRVQHMVDTQNRADNIESNLLGI